MTKPARKNPLLWKKPAGRVRFHSEKWGMVMGESAWIWGDEDRRRVPVKSKTPMAAK